MEQGSRKRNPWPKTAVWWDLDTCPIPEDYDLTGVPSIIQSVLKNNWAPGPVTMFAIGNLNDIDHEDLENISSSGILLRHSPYSGAPMLFDALCEWRQLNPPPANILLISDDKSWCSHSFLRFGYSVRRAFPFSKPAWTYSSAKEWEYFWETLLEGNSSSLVETDNQILEETDRPACFCRLCNVSMQSCDEFIEHLESSQHALNPHVSQNLFWFAAAAQQECSTLGVLDRGSPNEYDEPLLCCRLCKYSGYDLHNTIVHLYSKEHAQNELALERPNATIMPCEGFHKQFYAGPKTTGVWWDLNTCSVPDGYDPRCVRPSIEAALSKLFGAGPVTVFAIGNLDYVSAQLLEDISSSGIRLIHSPFGGGSEVFQLLNEWRECNPSPGNIMLISGTNSWYNNFLLFGYTILRVYPDSQPAKAYGSYKEWVWDTLLKENYVAPPAETNRQILEQKCAETGESAFCCRLCESPSQNCADFIKHLQGSKGHKDEMWDWVDVDENNKPEHFCEVCIYPAFDKLNLTYHKRSEGHKQKELAASAVPQCLLLGPSLPHDAEASLVC